MFYGRTSKTGDYLLLFERSHYASKPLWKRWAISFIASTSSCPVQITSMLSPNLIPAPRIDRTLLALASFSPLYLNVICESYFCAVSQSMPAGRRCSPVGFTIWNFFATMSTPFLAPDEFSSLASLVSIFQHFLPRRILASGLSSLNFQHSQPRRSPLFTFGLYCSKNQLFITRSIRSASSLASFSISF